MEAALVVTPIPSHHSISVYLSSHGIHNMCETTWCSTIGQAQDMIQTAGKNNVIVRVAENFFRVSIDRFAQKLRDSEYIGRIHRIFSYNEMTIPGIIITHVGSPLLGHTLSGYSPLNTLCQLYLSIQRHNVYMRVKTCEHVTLVFQIICWLLIQHQI